MNTLAPVTVISHPLVQHKLTKIRRRDTPKAEFRALLREISTLMGYEVFRTWPIETLTIETPLSTMSAPYITHPCTLVAILRAGLGMLDGILTLIPNAREGHIGLYRDHESKNAVRYMTKLPPANEGIYILIDPMLATGNSAVKAVDILKQTGVREDQVRFLSLVAAPEGIHTFHSIYPHIPIFTAAIDERLDENSYIIPGLGDAGDRMFGT